MIEDDADLERGIKSSPSWVYASRITERRSDATGAAISRINNAIKAANPAKIHRDGGVRTRLSIRSRLAPGVQGGGEGVAR